MKDNDRLVIFPKEEWVNIKSSNYIMGACEKKDNNSSINEIPQFEIYIDNFRLAKYPTTNLQYQCFIDDGGYEDKKWWEWHIDLYKWWNKLEPKSFIISDDERFNNPYQPVAGISWFEAMAYTRWLSAQSFIELNNDEIIRLPTEAEWEYAARGHDQRIYPWGNDWIDEYANTIELKLNSTIPVGCFPKAQSPFGVMDMAGNVWEWCLDVWRSYPNAKKENMFETDQHVLRGGSYFSSRVFARCTARGALGMSEVSNSNPGFRCCIGKKIDV